MVDGPDLPALSSSQREALRATLADQRAQTLVQVSALTRDFEGIVEASQLVSADDEHDPDGSTIAFERAQVSSLLQQVLRNLADLDRAAQELTAGTYGICEVCRRPISFERLEAVPTTRTCIQCAAGSGPFLRRS